MKQLQKTLYTALCLFLLIAPAQALYAQDKQKASAKELIESKNFVFRAESMMPMRGGVIHLTSSYDLQVSQDTVVAFLPYFGRAYTAPLQPGEGPLRFTSTDFSYEIRERRKRWDIAIKTKDLQYGEQLLLKVFDNGSAQLQVISNNRQPVSFNGYIQKAV